MVKSGAHVALRPLSLGALLLVAACSDAGSGPAPFGTGNGGTSSGGGGSNGTNTPGSNQTGGGGDVTPSTTCSVDTPFSEVGFPESDTSGINTDADERLPRLTPDELVLYFHRGSTMYRATRATRTDKFGPAAPVQLPTAGAEEPPPARDPFPSSDDGRVYFSAPPSPSRLLVAERSGNGLGEPRDVLPFEPPIQDSITTPFLWRSTLFFTRAAADGAHLWTGEVGPNGTLTALPTKLPNVAHAGATDSDPTLSEDGLVLYWFSTAGKTGGAGGLWVATRTDTTQPFSNPRAVSVSEETSRWLAPGFLSADYCRLYVYRESEPGSNRGDLGLLTRLPPPPR